MKWILPTIFCIIALVSLIWYKLDYANFDKLVATLNEQRPGLGGRTQSRRREVTPSGRRKRRISNVSIRRAAL